MRVVKRMLKPLKKPEPVDARPARHGQRCGRFVAQGAPEQGRAGSSSARHRAVVRILVSLFENDDRRWHLLHRHGVLGPRRRAGPEASRAGHRRSLWFRPQPPPAAPVSYTHLTLPTKRM